MNNDHFLPVVIGLLAQLPNRCAITSEAETNKTPEDAYTQVEVDGQQAHILTISENVPSFNNMIILKVHRDA